LKHLVSPRLKLAAAVVVVLGGVATAAFFGQRVYTHMTLTDARVAAAAGAPKPVMVKAVSRGPIEQVLGAEATATESQLVPIRTSLTIATVAEAPVKLGDVVQQGQLLIRFDAAVPAAKLESARRDLQSAGGDLALLQERIATLRELNARGLASDDELRSAALQESAIRARMTAATLKQQEAANELRATQIVAPVSGVITDGELYPGMVVRGGTDLMTLRAIDPIHVTAMLSQDKIKGVFIGQPVDLSLYAFAERRFEGKVVLVKPTVDNQTRLVPVIVRLENPQLEIMPGMNGIARLKSAREGLRAPSVAVMST
jgi:RND family efflux transporter MFP subunit